MARTTTKTRWIWAVDPFQDEGTLQEKVAEDLNHLAQQAGPGVVIDPVYVLGPDEIGWSLDISPPVMSIFKPQAEKVLSNWLTRSQVESLGSPVVLTLKRAGIRNSAKLLLAHATKMKAQMIVVGTHGREGISRAVLGSFTETLAQISKIPILSVGQESRAKEQFKELLVPTDLSAISLKGFASILKFANQIQANVTLLHVMPKTFEPMLAQAAFFFGGAITPFPHYNDEVARRRKQANRWLELAKKSKVDCEFVLDEDSPSITEGILQRSRSNQIDLVAMTPSSGPISATLLGSISRKVGRHASCPLGIFPAR